MNYVSTGACCQRCRPGTTRQPQGALGGLVEGPAVLLAGAALLACWIFGRPRNNPTKNWYVYSKERGAARAEFSHGPYTEGVAKARLSKERRMGLTASMRRKS